MEKQDNQTSGAVGVQVFELTMDNFENQDDLNRRLRKPGEPECNPPAKVVGTAQGETTTESVGIQKKTL
jgi:hypothetical protein